MCHVTFIHRLECNYFDNRLQGQTIARLRLTTEMFSAIITSEQYEGGLRKQLNRPDLFLLTMKHFSFKLWKGCGSLPSLLDVNRMSSCRPSSTVGSSESYEAANVNFHPGQRRILRLTNEGNR